MDSRTAEVANFTQAIDNDTIDAHIKRLTRSVEKMGKADGSQVKLNIAESELIASLESLAPFLKQVAKQSPARYPTKDAEGTKARLTDIKALLLPLSVQQRDGQKRVDAVVKILERLEVSTAHKVTKRGTDAAKRMLAMSPKEYTRKIEELVQAGLPEVEKCADVMDLALFRIEKAHKNCLHQTNLVHRSRAEFDLVAWLEVVGVLVMELLHRTANDRKYLQTLFSNDLHRIARFRAMLEHGQVISIHGALEKRVLAAFRICENLERVLESHGLGQRIAEARAAEKQRMEERLLAAKAEMEKQYNEEERKLKEVAAATTIQAVYRGGKGRELVASKALEQKKLEVAAIRIQAHFRGAKVRDTLLMQQMDKDGVIDLGFLSSLPFLSRFSTARASKPVGLPQSRLSVSGASIASVDFEF